MTKILVQARLERRGPKVRKRRLREDRALTVLLLDAKAARRKAGAS